MLFLPNPLPHHISRPFLVFHKGFTNILAEDAQHNQLYAADKQHAGSSGSPAGNRLFGEGVNIDYIKAIQESQPGNDDAQHQR